MRAPGARPSAAPAWRWSLAAALLLVPSFASAQVRSVLSKEVGIGERDASLVVGFTDGSSLQMAVRDGRVRIDGEEKIGRAHV